jgi:hypothetical protein
VDRSLPISYGIIGAGKFCNFETLFSNLYLKKH